MLLKCSYLLLFALLLTTGDGQKKKAENSGLNDRYQQLTEMAAKRAVIKLNSNKYRDLVKASPRNYSMVIMFTAMAPKRQCVVCKHAMDEYQIVANSYRYQQTPNGQSMFMAVVDFDEAQDVFQTLRLNTAPVLMHFPAKGKPKKSDTMDVQRVGFGAEAIAKWISEQTDVQIRVLRPPNYSGTIALVTLFAVVGSLLYLRRNNLEFLYNRNMWAATAVLFTLIMTSGQMWNHIRGPPFVHKTGSGNIAYVHGSSQGQFVLETYIILGINAATVLGMILVTEAADSGSKGDVRKRRILSVIGISLFAVFFSLELSIFRSKAHGYPYSFLFK
nr:EOG090X09EZ [Triops cancriformis]